MKNFRILIIKYTIGTLMGLALPNLVYPKPLSKLRKFLYPIHFNFNVGSSYNYYTLITENVIPFERNGALYIHNLYEGNSSAYLFRSFGAPLERVQLYESTAFWDTLRARPTPTLSDEIGFGIPITLSAHIDILKKFRLELGSSVSINFVKELEPTETYKQNGTPSFVDASGRHYVVKFFLMPGFKLFENYAYTLLINTHAALSFMYSDFLNDKSAGITALRPIPVGLGITFEKHISEYLSIFGRGFYENTVNTYGFISKDSSNNLIMTAKSFSLQVGVTAHTAEIPKCPLPNCEITDKHNHASTAYRGSSWVKGRNSLGRRLYDK